ncbi:MAG TPA: hypothetical protein VFA73_10225, partial [Actinomycetota bacterium]|nr:hypothetical protein [Actinomycetota bacterium]
MTAWRRVSGRARLVAGVGLVAVAVALAALAGLAGGGDPAALGPAAPGRAATTAPAAAAPAVWERVEPGGRTRCGRGGRFAFWARMGAPDRLLVFFEGGGGSWDYRSCARGAGMFDDRVDAGDDPSRAAGVLDLDDPRNPFNGWSALFVPSCTGDVFAGDAVRTYRAADGRAVTVHHRGHVNASAALD